MKIRTPDDYFDLFVYTYMLAALLNITPTQEYVNESANST